MAFKIDSVVPWGRNMEEYKLMFRLSDNDLKKKFAVFIPLKVCLLFAYIPLPS